MTQAQTSLRELVAKWRDRAAGIMADAPAGDDDFDAAELSAITCMAGALHGCANELQAALDVSSAPGEDALDAKRWQHAREMFAEEMLDSLFGIDACPDTDPTYQLDAACDADIESDAAMIAATEGPPPPAGAQA